MLDENELSIESIYTDLKAIRIFVDSSEYDTAIYCCDDAIDIITHYIQRQSLDLMPVIRMNYQAILAEYYYLRGECYVALGIDEKAEESFILGCNNSQPNTTVQKKNRMYLVSSYLKQKKYSQANAIHQEIIDQCSRDNAALAYSHYEIGRAYQEQGEIQLAIDNFKQAISKWLIHIQKKDQAEPDGLLLTQCKTLQSLYVEHKYWGHARDLILQMLQRPQVGGELKIIYYQAFGDHFFNLKNYTLAINAYSEVMKMTNMLGIDAPKTYEKLAQALVCRGTKEDTDLSIEYFSVAIRTEQDIRRHAALYHWRAQAYLKQGDKEKATRSFSQYLQLLSQERVFNANQLIDQALHAEQWGHVSDATNLFENAQDIFCNLVTNFNSDQNSDFDTIAPPSWLTLAALAGDALTQTKLPNPVETVLDSLPAEKLPFECRYIQAIALRAQGKPELAIPYFQEIDRLYRARENRLTLEQRVQFYYQWSLAHYELAQYEQAKAVFHQAECWVNMAGYGGPHYCYQYGLTLQKLGEYEAAAHKFVQVIHLSKQKPDFKLFFLVLAQLADCNEKLRASSECEQSELPIAAYPAAILDICEAYIESYDPSRPDLTQGYSSIMHELENLQTVCSYESASTELIDRLSQKKPEISDAPTQPLAELSMAAIAEQKGPGIHSIFEGRRVEREASTPTRSPAHRSASSTRPF